jgi:hypothetical protein
MTKQPSRLDSLMQTCPVCGHYSLWSGTSCSACRNPEPKGRKKNVKIKRYDFQSELTQRLEKRRKKMGI